LVASNITEWAVHKYVLHGLGKKKTNWWAFHWHDHHGSARRHGNADDDYLKPFYAAKPRLKEAAALVGLAAVHLPLLPIAPFYTGTVLWRIVHYYRVHKKSHVDIAWAREHLPWHFDHHMGPDQDQNWCVTHPWFDEVMGTRVPYAGTEREAEDAVKREKLKARRAEAAEATVTAKSA